MRLVRDERGPVDVYVLTGDGEHEYRVLEAIVEHYDHSKMLRWIGRGGAELSYYRDYREKLVHAASIGLEGVVRRLARLLESRVGAVKVDVYLVLIDREHVANKDAVVEALRRHGFDVEDVGSPHPQYLRLKVRRGTRQVVIHLVVLGRRKSIEEHIAELINKMYNANVGASKKEIRRWLRAHGLDLREVLKQASRRGLIRETIPQLHAALSALRSCKPA